VRHVILDRDGVLNAEAAGGFVRQADDWVWLPGALDALGRLSTAGLRLSVATNQSAVGRGLMSVEDLTQVHARMLAEAEFAGAVIAAVHVCPHAPWQSCACRKPRPGLVLEAIAASGLPGTDTQLVGDDLRDIEAALAAGIRPVLLRSGKGGRHAEDVGRRGVPVYDDLAGYAEALLADLGTKTP